MAYQTKSDEFFNYLHQLLRDNKVDETIKFLSDASSADPTLNGDLKFLKLRANKKLMVPAGGMGATDPKQQIQEVVKLVEELKKAHARRPVMVSTAAKPSKKAIKAIRKETGTAPKKSSRVPLIIFLLMLMGGGAAAFFYRDQIMQNEYVQSIIPADLFSNEDAPEEPKKKKTEKKKKKTTKKKTTPKKENKTTESSTSTEKEVVPKSTAPKPSSKASLQDWYIQIASYANLDQARDKRKRVEMSFDKAIILQKDFGQRENYRILIPGFANKEAAETFKTNRKVNNLYRGAYVQAFANECSTLTEIRKGIYRCE